MLRIDKAILDTDRVVCDNIRQLSGTDTITYKLTNQQFILNIVNKIVQLYLQSYFIPGAYSFEDIFC